MKHRAPLLAALGALAVAAPVNAQDTEWNRYTLEGLPGVFVRAEANQGCESVGMPASAVQADAAVVLLEGDVPLLTEEEMLADVALPELRITLECTAGGNGASGTVGFSVSVRMQQAVKMIRDEQITLSEAVTWFTTEVGVASAAGAQGAIKALLAERLGEFTEAYAAANGEEGGPG